MSIEQYEPNTPAQIRENASFGGDVDLHMWANNLSDAHKLATALCGTSFVPQGFRGKAEEAAAAIMLGKSLGMDPMVSLTNIFVVSGRPSMYARAAAALVMSQGHELILTESTPERVTYKARRKGTEEWSFFSWNQERAKIARYDRNPLYKKNPQEMLGSKAIMEACRVIAPDVLSGIPYSAEEIQLFDENSQQQATPPEQKTRKVSRKPKPEPAQEQAVETVTDELEAEVIDETPDVDWSAQIEAYEGNVEGLRWLFDQANVQGAGQEVIDAIATAGRAAAGQETN